MEDIDGRLQLEERAKALQPESSELQLSQVTRKTGEQS